ncbi:unnamed protein product [Caenorhabditis auriculariae]|uniref:Uncharacterized protein n=1 Tax=Caenorhabditis auriculariae TaxID=2777116 RepID=A0A8S1GZU9_9PELO|nr:unnamed protein product [Caenorhabditis auriculariae]
MRLRGREKVESGGDDVGKWEWQKKENGGSKRGGGQCERPSNPTLPMTTSKRSRTDMSVELYSNEME